VRQSSLQMNAGAADDSIRIILGTSQPADILTARERIMKAISRFSAKCFKQVGSYFTHVLEHARAMPGDGVGIHGSRKSNSE